jgi:hypothetical protein
VRALRNGSAGWLCALLPLIVVNTLGYIGLLDTSEALLAGAVALVGSPLLGGAVVGLLSGRPWRGSAGGASAALGAGAIAGGLYLASLLGLVIAAAGLDAEPELLAAHPIRVALATIFLACVLAAVGLGVAAVVGQQSRITPGPRAGSLPQGHAAGPGATPATRRTRTLASAVPTAATRTRATVGASAPRPMSRPMMPPDARRPTSDRGARR